MQFLLVNHRGKVEEHTNDNSWFNTPEEAHRFVVDHPERFMDVTLFIMEIYSTCVVHAPKVISTRYKKSSVKS